MTQTPDDDTTDTSWQDRLRPGRPDFEPPEPVEPGYGAGRFGGPRRPFEEPGQPVAPGARPAPSAESAWPTPEEPPASWPEPPAAEDPSESAADAPAAPVAAGPRAPVITYSIIAVCVLVWLAELAFAPVTAAIDLVPALAFSEPWRFLTSAFAHAHGFAHIGFNMYALWVLGRSLEPFLGRARFTASYLVSALAGGVTFVAMASPDGDGVIVPGWTDGMIGASGAIFGLFGVLLIVQRRLGASTRALWVVLAINAALVLFIPGIAWQAHVGGFLGGLASGWIVFDDVRRLGRGQPARTWPRMIGLVLAMVVIVLVKFAIA